MQKQEKIYTLAQSGTGNSSNSSTSPQRILHGAGSDMNDKTVLKSRARRKTISQRLSLRLIEAAEKKGEPDRAKAYRNAYYCQNRVVSHNGRIHSPYCKSRLCTVCCSIRKAEIINRYLPVIQTWEDPFFVTLTVKAVPAEKLERWLFGFKKAFRRIREKCKKQHQRGKGDKLIGIKSLECNFNPKARTYNPHLHLVVLNERIADLLINEWLTIWTKQHARRVAQNKQRVRDVERSLVEVVKYGSKIFTDPEGKKTRQSTCPPHVYASALDNIFKAMKPYRIFERFGFNLPQQKKHSQKVVVEENQCAEWVFQPASFDWENPETQEVLTGHKPSTQLKWLLDENIDTDLQ